MPGEVADNCLCKYHRYPITIIIVIIIIIIIIIIQDNPFCVISTGIKGGPVIKIPK